MAESRRVKDHICFIELTGFIYEDDYNQTPTDFLVKKENLLPIIMRVTGGYCGQTTQTTFSSDEVYFVTHMLTQKRVIVKDHLGQMLSFPADHHLQFFTFIDGVKSNESWKLEEIVMLDEVILSRKTELIPDPKRGERIDFCVGPDATVSLELGLMTFMASYDERYIVGNSIVHQKLHDRAFIIPLWMPITVDAAIGFTDKPHAEYERLLKKMSVQSKCFSNATAPGNKDIMLFMDDIGDYEGVYDVIVPRNKDYARLPAGTDIEQSIGPPPEVLPRVPVEPKSLRKAPKPKKDNHGFMKIFSGIKLLSKSLPDGSKPQAMPQTVQPDIRQNPSSYEYIETNQMDRIPDNSSDDTYDVTFTVQNRLPRSNSTSAEIPERRQLPSPGNTSPRSKLCTVLNSRSVSNADSNKYPKKTSPTIESKSRAVAKGIQTRRHDMYEQCDPVANVYAKEDYNIKSDDTKQGVVKPMPLQSTRNKPMTAVKPMAPTKPKITDMPNVAKEPLTGGYGQIWPKNSPGDFAPPEEEKSEYVSYAELPKTCKGMSVKQICDCLRLLKFEHHISTFEGNDIDGELLYALDEKSLKEFGFSNFEAKKMIKFINGWRPNINK